MVYFDAPLPEDRPGFSMFDMLAEWTDHLDVNNYALPDAEIHCFDPALIAELVRIHTEMFRERCYALGIHWNSFTGELWMSNDLAGLVQAGIEERPTREDVDYQWGDAFDFISSSIFEIEERLRNRS